MDSTRECHGRFMLKALSQDEHPKLSEIQDLTFLQRWILQKLSTSIRLKCLTYAKRFLCGQRFSWMPVARVTEHIILLPIIRTCLHRPRIILTA